MAAPNRTNTTVDAALIVALHRVHEPGATGTSHAGISHAGISRAGIWHAVAVRRAESEHQPMRLVETRSFAERNGEPPRAEIGRWCDERRAGRIVVLLPPGRVICRTCSLPAGPPERLLAALRLQAESHLAGTVPPHRLGLAVLPATAEETTRQGIITGWPESAAPIASPLPDRGGGAGRSRSSDPTEPTWISEAAALAAIIDRNRPQDAALWLCRDEGVVALGFTSPAGLVLRTTREEAGDADEWRAAVRRVVLETALAAGVDSEGLSSIAARLDQRLVEVDGTMLLLPDEVRDSVRERVAGEPPDPVWWNQYGLALGAALCAAGDMAGLARLRASPSSEHPTALGRVARSLSKPRTSTLLAVLALTLFAFGPLAFARVRLGILRSKAPDLASLRERNADDARRRAMYSELRAQTLPMSKLLADIANTTPMGIELQSILVDRAQGVQISGVAAPDAKGEENQPPGERVARMAAMMEATGVFELPKREVKPPSPGKGDREFSLTSSVIDAFRRAEYPEEQDFGAVTMVTRLYGPAPASGPSTARDGDASAPGDDSEGGGADAPNSDGTGLSGEAALASGRAAERGGPRPSSGGRAARSGSRADAEGTEAPADGADAASESAAGERSDSSRRDGGLARRGAGDTGGGAARRGDRLGAAPVVPAPLTREEINVMTATQVKDALSAVSVARQDATLDTDVKTRLADEFRMLIARQMEIRSGSGEGAR